MKGRFRPTLVVFATGLAVALSLFGDMAMYVILPAQNAVLGYSAVQVGLLLSVNRWIRLVTNQAAQRLIRRWGTRIAFPASLLVGSLLAAGYAAAPSFGVMLLLRMVWGACWSIIRHTGVMTANDASDPDTRGRSMGIYMALVNVGFVAGTFTAGWFFDWGGYQRAFLLASALSLAALPAAFAANGREGMFSADSGKNLKVKSEYNPGISVYRKFIETESIGFSLICRGFIVSFVGTGLIMSTLGFMLRERFGASVNIGGISVGVTALTGMLLSIRSLINFVGSPAAGTVLDRIGHDFSLWIGFGISGTALLAAAVFDTTTVVIWMIVFFFIGAMTARLAVESQAAQLGHRSYAALATSTDLGSALGPMLGWLGIELSQSGLVFWVGGFLLLLAMFLPSRTRISR